MKVRKKYTANEHRYKGKIVVSCRMIILKLEYEALLIFCDTFHIIFQNNQKNI